MKADAAPATAPHDPYSALRHRPYRDYISGSFIALIGRQAVLTVALWQVYDWTHSLAAVGFVGFVNVLPLLAFSLPAGALTDRHDRRRIIALGTGTLAVVNLALAALAFGFASIPDLPVLHWGNTVLRAAAGLFERHADAGSLRFDHPALPIFFALLFVHATVRVLIWPSRSSITPLLVPNHALGNAITWGTSAFEVSTISGPLIGGLALGKFGAAAVYAAGSGFEIVFLLLLRRVRYCQEPTPAPARRSWRDAFAGAEFIWRKKVILAASVLDLFAVLLGGVVAVLPVYADRILHVGPAGFGCLRAAPSVGAIAMAMWAAHRPPLARPGTALLWAVGGFGAAIILFGVSHTFWLSLLALFLTGACDNISVVVRQSLVQLLTPDSLRGRVTAFNQIFIGSSNEIGALRAGLMSAVVGPVAAVVWGGLGTIAVTLAVAKATPNLAKLPPLNSLRPDDPA